MVKTEKNSKKDSHLDENIFKKIIEVSFIGLAVCEFILEKDKPPTDYRFLFVNQAFEQQSGIKVETAIGKTIKEIYPDIEQLWIDKYLPTLLGKTVNIENYNHNTNKCYRVKAFNLFDNKFVMAFEDITNEHKIKEDLKKSEKDYRQLFDSMLVLFQVIELVYDKKGNAVDYYYRQVNPAFEQLVQKSKSQLIGKRVKSVFGIIEDYWLELYDRVEKTGTSEIIENYGAELDKHYQVNAWKAGKGKVAVLFADITEQKRHELELIKAREEALEGNRLKSAFLANMSHEIRTPMNGILGFTSFLRDPNITYEEQLQYTSIIEESGKRMLNLINDIVDISKIESGSMHIHLKKSNINNQINYLQTFFKPEVESKGVRLIYKSPLPSDEAIIETDSEKIFAILTNLIKNAIKFTDAGTIEFGYLKKGNYLEFFVKDTGIGIAVNEQAVIFDRFVQAENTGTQGYEGSGLGLAISKAYVEMLGGKIWVKSELGKGSLFKFTIPYEVKLTTNETIIKKNNGSGVNKVNTMKVVVADDDKISNYLLSIMLKKKNHQVLQAVNGEEAVAICRKNPDIDLVLMDIRMPLLDGYEATKQIRKFNKTVVIIAQTAFAFTGDNDKALEAGCTEYITKPIDQDKLNALILKHFKN